MGFYDLSIEIPCNPPTADKSVVDFPRAIFDLLSVFSVTIIIAYEAAKTTKT